MTALGKSDVASMYPFLPISPSDLIDNKCEDQNPMCMRCGVLKLRQAQKV